MDNKDISIIEHSVLQEKEFIDSQFPEPNYEVDSVGFIHWEIPNWSQLETKVRSNTFKVGNYNWNILLYPQGNQAAERVSIYLEYSDASTSEEDWHVCSQFLLCVSNHDNPSVFISSNAFHRFNSDETDWGFTSFIDQRRLVSPNSSGIPLLQNDKIRISAFVKVAVDPTGVLWHNFLNWNSKKETGHVGFKNQGATCYMNSLLQSLYFTNQFRRAVFQIPTKDDDPKKSIPLALQRVFYNLQTSSSSVGTTELTSSFGWDSAQAFMQHDVQEFNRVLQDNLETKMKGTEADGAIARLFEGKMKSYIKCVNVEFESSRVENYYDISLNVKGCKTLRDSFVDYCQVETLDGDNKYMAEGYGLQDARKGVIFESFPPVLQLHLKRFEYDFTYDNMVKINDRHEYPSEIDLSEFLSKESIHEEPWEYVLHGVLVHSGDLNSGHYFAHIKTDANGKWFKFDDDHVIPVSDSEVYEENYGGEYPQHRKSSNDQARNPNYAPPVPARNPRVRFTNAYMLVYLRKSRLGDILDPITPEMIPHHLIERNEQAKEDEERKRREKNEIHLYTNLLLVTDSFFKSNKEFDLVSFEENLDVNSPLVHKVRKNLLFSDFATQVAKTLDVEIENLRFWNFMRRYNGTIRLDSPMFNIPPNYTMDQIQPNRIGNIQLPILYCEIVENPNSVDLSSYLCYSEKNNILIHIKYYDPFTKSITGLGKLYLNESVYIEEIVPYLLKMNNMSPSTHITLFEEVYPGSIMELNRENDIKTSQLQTGDIICFQKTLTQDQAESFNNDESSLPDAPSYYEHIQNSVNVTFIQIPDSHFNTNSVDSDDSQAALNFVPNSNINLSLSLKNSYNYVVSQLASAINLSNPLKIRLVQNLESVNVLSSNTFGPSSTLADIIPSNIQNNQNVPHIIPTSCAVSVYYQILDVSLEQLEKLRKINVTYIGKSLRDTHSIEIFIEKTSATQDLIEAIYPKVSQILESELNSKNNIPNHQKSISISSTNSISSSPPKNSATSEITYLDSSSIKPFGLRVYEVSSHHITRFFTGREFLSSIPDVGVTIVAERTPSITDIPASESELSNDPSLANRLDQSSVENTGKLSQGSDQGEKVIQVFHFNRNILRSHSIPFSLRLFPNEPFYPDTWLRIKSKLGVGEKEFSKVRPAFVPHSDLPTPIYHYIDAETTNEESLSNLGLSKSLQSTGPDNEFNMDASLSPDANKMEFEQNSQSICSESGKPIILYNIMNDSKDLLALDHIDRNSRSRIHNEAQIKILS
ncbi:Ubiquitin carboxyl-terminal hydrolase 21 [Smittium culicis]|uniref:ubiquitinyl hydrolase 1 n=2 Tax=Smittium culicis TaxID=133412 RepID=A0A1R1YTL2_9FUNG|nr:Ubiquitin carboxyl-terminal hydrolase 21 [Smittium culicis]